MISVILATEDPYKAAREFLSLGWKLVSETPADSDDKLSIVSLGDAKVMLGVDEPRFLPEAAREHRGAGVEMYIRLRARVNLDSIYSRHLKGGVVTKQLESVPFGGRAFHARIYGYNFLIAGE